MRATPPARIRNGDISFWFQDADDGRRRKPLASSTDVDVVIVGAGYTGLWTAYYLKNAAPDMRIAILERETAGFGASGRNGGWISYGLPGQASKFAAASSKDRTIEFQRQIFDSIDEIIEVAAREHIDADISKDGEIAIATNAAQVARLRAEQRDAAHWGFGSNDLRWIEASELKQFARVEGARSGLWSPHCARVQPAGLARGLARVVEQLDVPIYEDTEVVSIDEKSVTTSTGYRVSGEYVICATEGFTPDLPGMHRLLLPKLSSMIVTAPLPTETIEEISWHSNVMVRDAGHFFSYIHKTRENRIALGGPGVPYFFGSRADRNGETPIRSLRELRMAINRLFPALREVRIDHTWTGVLGIPRDWSAVVTVDHDTGFCRAGGYVGDGVSSANLAARTLRDLILRHDTRLTKMPWVDKNSRKWEPEPLRWIALNGLYSVYTLADRLEANSNSDKTSWLARTANIITGRT